MKTSIFVAALTCGGLFAQGSANLSGGWKSTANPNNSTYVIYDQQGDQLKERKITNRGKVEQRTEAAYKLDGSESTNIVLGAPAKVRAKLEGNSVTFESAGRGGAVVKETLTPSADGKTLNGVRHTVRNGNASDENFTLEKSDEAAEAFAKPEKKAGDCYANLKVLQNAPCSQVITAMHRFETTLGVNCGHCHVVPQFDKDDKPAKETTRKMMAMVGTLNNDLLKGIGRVSCYTCHRGQPKPALNPPAM